MDEQAVHSIILEGIIVISVRAVPPEDSVGHNLNQASKHPAALAP